MRRRLSSDGVTIAGGACAVLAVVLVLVLSVAAGPAAAAPLGTITIETPQACQVLQRDDAGVADMVVAGSCSGFNGPVEVRWGSGPWQTVDCALDGSFRTVLPSQPAGQASLTVRSALFPDVATACENVSVGDIYVIAGQSNASGRSPTLFTCADPVLQPALFGNDDCWRRLADPVDSSVGQVDRVSADRDAGGSVWPLVAQYLMADERVPVAFVPCAHVGSRIDRWQRDPWTPQAPGTLYGSMLRRIKAVGGRVRAVLFWQGEADAACRTPRSTYAALLRRLGDDVQQDCGAPLVAAQIGDYGPRYSG